jgi:hypothetical protein
MPSALQGLAHQAVRIRPHRYVRTLLSDPKARCGNFSFAMRLSYLGRSRSAALRTSAAPDEGFAHRNR